MKVILLQDVARIGKRHSIVSVPDGYALNQLIPKKMAAPATPENLKKVQKVTADKQAGQSADETTFITATKTLKETKLTIAANMNEKEHLFKAVSADEVVMNAAAIGVTLTPAQVRFSAPVKEAGDHEILLVHGAHSVPVTITVVKK